MSTNQESNKTAKDLFIERQALAFTDSKELAGYQYRAKVRVSDGKYVTPNSEEAARMPWPEVDLELINILKTLKGDNAQESGCRYINVSLETLKNHTVLKALLSNLAEYAGIAEKHFALVIHHDIDEELLDACWALLKQYGFRICLDNFGLNEWHKELLIQFKWDGVNFLADRLFQDVPDVDVLEYCHDRNITTLYKNVSKAAELNMLEVIKPTLIQGKIVEYPKLLHQGIRGAVDANVLSFPNKRS